MAYPTQAVYQIEGEKPAAGSPRRWGGRPGRTREIEILNRSALRANSVLSPTRLASFFTAMKRDGKCTF